MTETVETLFVEREVKKGGYSYEADCDRKVVAEHVHHAKERGWVDSFYTGIGAFILWFVVLVVLIWIIIFSLHPSWVMQTNNPSQVDTGKVLLASIIIALLIIIIVWIIKLLLAGCRY